MGALLAFLGCLAWQGALAMHGKIGNLYIACHCEVDGGVIGDKVCSLFAFAPWADWALVHNELPCVTVL